MNKDLVVCLPTRDGTTQTITTSTIYEVALKYLKRTPTFIIGEAGNIPRSRNVCSGMLRAKYPGRTHAWALWLDSDIQIRTEFAMPLARNIEDAERTKKNFVVNYVQRDHQNVLMKQRSLHGAEHYTDEELMGLPPGAEIPMAGLGCVYMYTPLNYTWHADVAGEDVHFLLDNPDLHLYYAPNIQAIHKRNTALMPPKTW